MLKISGRLFKGSLVFIGISNLFLFKGKVELIKRKKIKIYEMRKFYKNLWFVQNVKEKCLDKSVR